MITFTCNRCGKTADVEFGELLHGENATIANAMDLLTDEGAPMWVIAFDRILCPDCALAAQDFMDTSPEYGRTWRDRKDDPDKKAVE